LIVQKNNRVSGHFSNELYEIVKTCLKRRDRRESKEKEESPVIEQPAQEITDKPPTT